MKRGIRPNLVAIVLASAAVGAQERAKLVDIGIARGDCFGYSIANLGDIDGDGVPDQAIGNPLSFYDDSTERIWGFSGSDGHVLFELAGPESGYQFLCRDVANGLGAWLRGLGDTDGDGVPDFAMYASPGRVEIRSGRDLHVRAVVGCPWWIASEFPDGCPIAALGDVDGDGCVDFVVKTTVYSGRTCKAIVELDTFANSTATPCPVARVGDLDGDCIDDLAIGLPSCTPGRVQVCSSRTGARLTDIAGRTWADRSDPDVARAWTKSDGSADFELRFGCSITDVGDVDGDGQTDLLVASVDGVSGNAMCSIYSPLTCRRLSTRDGAPAFVTPVFNGFDLDGDGVAEITYSGDPGTAGFTVHRLRDDAVVWRADLDDRDGWASWGTASTFECAGDVDRDGVPDLLVGVRQEGSPGLPGYVCLVSGRDGHEIRKFDTISSLQKVGKRR